MTVTLVPPTNLMESSVPDEESNNKFGLSLVPSVCCALSKYVVLVSVLVSVEEIVNSVALVLVTVTLVPPVIVISSLPEASDGSNLIAVVDSGTSKS